VLDALIAEARVRFGLDAAAGLAVVTAERLVATPIEPSLATLVVPAARLRATIDPAAPVPGPVPGRHGADGRDPLAVLRRIYPADHPVGRLGEPEGTTVGAMAAADLAAPLYLAPVPPVANSASPWGMPWISDRLRAPDGCPWDREQTHASLRNHLLEEAYEVYDALEAGATPALAGELGDLLLQVVLHAQLAAEAGVFDLTDVWTAIASKIVRRHPHVFGEAEARTASDVNRQWERIKQGERAAAAEADGGEAPAASALDGISRSLPSLAASQEMQERAAHLGYDWPSIDGVLEKVREEVGELVEAEDDAHRAEELGDLLFVLVNVGRKCGVEVEAALRAANEKFRRRFRHVELAAHARDVALRDMTFEELDALWDAAKADERGEASP
jgi:tetrapyrrole methylase family protein/MazG family protein